MQDTTMTNGSSSPPPAVAMNGQSNGASAATAFTPKRVQELVAALEDPFDPSEIKWRVTNTCKVGGPKGPRDRGQMLAYADPRAGLFGSAFFSGETAELWKLMSQKSSWPTVSGAEATKESGAAAVT